MNKSILVIAAHPDDEVLGCGGTIARHVIDGDTVNIVFMSDGVKSRINSTDDAVDNRKKAAINASKVLGLSCEHIFLGFPDNSIDTIPLLELVQSLEKVVQKFLPDVVYTHHAGDLNIDHQLTHDAAMTACRPLPGFCVKEIYSFEVLSSSEWSVKKPFIPNYFVDISTTFELKMLAIKQYDFEMRKFPHPRSIEAVEALYKFRGAISGLKAAEAFIVERLIYS